MTVTNVYKFISCLLKHDKPKIEPQKNTFFHCQTGFANRVYLWYNGTNCKKKKKKIVLTRKICISIQKCSVTKLKSTEENSKFNQVAEILENQKQICWVIQVNRKSASRTSWNQLKKQILWVKYWQKFTKRGTELLYFIWIMLNIDNKANCSIWKHLWQWISCYHCYYFMMLRDTVWCFTPPGSHSTVLNY